MITERRFLTGFRSADADTPGLVQEDDGTVWLVAPDGTRTQISGGGSSSFAAQILVVEWHGTMTDCSKTSDGLVPQFADFTIDYQKGTDLSLVDYSHNPGAAAFKSAAGGSFGVQTYIGANLTADAGSAVQRFIQFYTAGLFGRGIPDLGSDLLLALVDGFSVDNASQSLPYFDVLADEHFGEPSFSGVAGVAADSVALNIQMTAWSF